MIDYKRYCRITMNITVVLLFIIMFAMSNIIYVHATGNTSKYSYNDFIGKWESDTYLTLYVYKDGSFETVDIGAGNPGVKGTLKVISDSEIKVNCKYDVDFDSYFKIKRKDVLQYSFDDKGQLAISYAGGENNDVIHFTLVSRKVNKSVCERLPKPKIKDIRVKNRKLNITLTEDESVSFSGYEVMYRIAGKKWSTRTINKNREKYVLKISDIKKKKYRVKARSYFRLGDNIYYSKWTKVKSYNVKQISN